MLEVMKRCFPTQFESEKWQNKLKEMIPSFGQSLANNEGLLEAVRERSAELLQLHSRKHTTVEH